MGADSGYVVLPPIAAILFKSVGRSPLAGVAAVFCGIGAGFSANLLITSLDPLLSSLTETGARVIEPGYEVNAARNWWFMIACDSLATTAPVIVLAFFAGQFIAYFKYSQLDQLLAYSLGKALAESQMSPLLLLAAFILPVMVLNVLISSASAKWTLFAPVFVPIFMLMQISPELTQAAYRIADSCTNIVTPLNAYLVLLLAVCQKCAPRSGTGTLISMMTPYSVTFAVLWTIFLLTWVALGFDLGIDGGLEYAPPAPAAATPAAPPAG